MAKRKKLVGTVTLMDSMLNYLEIEQGSSKDEKMSKKNLKKFLQSIQDSYERQVVDDMVRKIKDKMKEDDGDEFDENDLDMDFDDPSEDKRDGRKLPKMPSGIFGLPEGAFNPEIEKFLAWLSGILYSGDHRIEVTSDGNKTSILVIKLDNDTEK